jgi:hypothetical protein
MPEAIESFRSGLLSAAGFELHGFCKRQGGVSEGPLASLNFSWDREPEPARVTENHARLRALLGTGLPLARVRQVHGATVREAREILAAGPDGWLARPELEADAVLAGPGEAVAAVITADCAPVLLADPGSRIVAAVHAGWRGAAKGVIRGAVRALVARGAEPGRLLAAVGPCICAACYEVGDEVARHFPESADPIRGRPGKHLLDLGNAVEVSLIGAGLTTRNIERIAACTACDGEFLFSHRASQGTCGASLAFIAG